ncbi:hypothetical protein [Microcella sp.]|uniref:hypothetical protein n=1 Tax=Microcella sp. TaxID=1913979 RepID=UPI00256645AE|nr:hypothetical protein [Microcella sp.]MBX9472348.1 hypothetical protein [Microcella sp.]
MTLTRTAAALVATPLIVLMALAGCSTSVDSELDPSTQSSTQTPVALAEPDPGIALPAAPATTALPAGVEPESDAALAWDALMSPVGEYAAAASYLAVLDSFGMVEPYATILEGELRHIDALTRQLERAGIEVPENPYIGIVVAPADLQTAAEAWAQGEINNVALYDELLTQADDARLVKVLGNLRRASLESHLPLFEAAAAAGGTLDELPAHTP